MHPGSDTSARNPGPFGSECVARHLLVHEHMEVEHVLIGVHNDLRKHGTISLCKRSAKMRFGRGDDVAATDWLDTLRSAGLAQEQGGT